MGSPKEMATVNRTNNRNSLLTYAQSILRGIGQVMFQNNPYSGLLFLAGIFYNSPLLAIAAIAGTIISTSTASVLNYPKQDITDGIYGFNGTLVGIAIYFFLGFNLTTSLVLIICAIVSSPINFYLKKAIPSFTAPFIIATWLGIYIVLWLTQTQLSSGMSQDNTMQLFLAGTHGFGQVMFQENSVTGLLFLIGILINSRIAAAYALYAAFLGILVGWLCAEPHEVINAGLMGYNGILCAIALTDTKRYTVIWVSIAVILSVFMTIGFAKTPLLTLTAPFVLSTWAVLKLKSLKTS